VGVSDIPTRWQQRIRQRQGCWLWTGATRHGYAAIWWGGKVRIGHRLLYQLAHGRVPKHMTLDHLCRRTTCVNPAHLEVVSRVENLRRAGFGGTRPVLQQEIKPAVGLKTRVYQADRKVLQSPQVIYARRLI